MKWLTEEQDESPNSRWDEAAEPLIVSTFLVKLDDIVAEKLTHWLVLKLEIQKDGFMNLYEVIFYYIYSLNT